MPRSGSRRRWTPSGHVQWALYPEGAFIHVDSGSLELGLVRDSTLNSTNDFQIFGETFENVARLAPAQACYWITSDICAIGAVPARRNGTDLRLIAEETGED